MRPMEIFGQKIDFTTEERKFGLTPSVRGANFDLPISTSFSVPFYETNLSLQISNVLWFALSIELNILYRRVEFRADLGAKMMRIRLKSL